MRSDAHRKLPGREEKINHLIHENRFDLFNYVTVPVYIPGGALMISHKLRNIICQFSFSHHNSSKTFQPPSSGEEKLDQATSPRGPVQGPDCASGIEAGWSPNTLSPTAHGRKQRPPSPRPPRSLLTPISQLEGEITKQWNRESALPVLHPLSLF